ncbi:hypothetical protein AB0395_20935 [Streptosporangium sp. NPDC051023]|uniref:hypothetical protein n=1 Tax=Streptosporangium sp. NPDC051023 TaxID=3155410 RepID=UPI00344DCC61
MITNGDPSYVMSFRDADGPVDAFTTRIGGGPDWVGEAQWPLCARWDNPMAFVGQFRLAGDELRMAYLFMCDSCEETWEPEAGKNALIVQPGRVPPFVTTMVPLWESTPGGMLVDLEIESPGDLEHEESRMYGSPAWLQYEQYPPGGPWSFLFQLDSRCDWLNHLNFGIGVGYGFISGDEQEGRFLWQC